MEVCSSTFLPSHNPSFSIHWPNGFRVLRETFLPRGLDLSIGAGFPSNTNVTTQQVTNGSVPVCTRSSERPPGERGVLAQTGG